MDRGDLVAAYLAAALFLGGGVIVWGYRADRRGVPFPWARYWHWWRVCVAYGLLAAPSVIPVSWLIYWGPPPRGVFDAAAGTSLLFVFAMSTLHWRLWFPAFGMGLALRTYLRHTLRTAGYSAALAVAGAVAVFLVGRVISG